MATFWVPYAGLVPGPPSPGPYPAFVTQTSHCGRQFSYAGGKKALSPESPKKTLVQEYHTDILDFVYETASSPIVQLFRATHLDVGSVLLRLQCRLGQVVVLA